MKKGGGVIFALAVSAAIAVTGAVHPVRAQQPEAPWILAHARAVLGGAVMATVGLAALDHPTVNELQEPRLQRNDELHQFAGDIAFMGGDGPFAISVGLAAAGIGGDAVHRFAIHDVEAIALATGLAGITKGIAGRALPGVNVKPAFQFGRGFHDRNGPFVSFPSGHTAAAFALAATLSGEVGRDSVPHARAIQVAAFTLATTVGLARVIQGVHWPSDLPLGAFIGTWSGYVVQAHANRADRVDRLLRGVTMGRDRAGRTLFGWSSLPAGGP